MSHLGRSLRRTPARQRNALRVALALAVALLLHAGIVAWMARVPWALPPAEVQPVTLAPLSAAEWAKNQAIAGERPRPAPPAAVPAPVPPDERHPKGQFVDLYSPADKDSKEKPDHARFDSGIDHRVEKETISRFRGADHGGRVLDKPSVGGLQAKATPPPGEGGEAKEHADGAPGAPPQKPVGPARKLELPPQQPQQEVALAQDGKGEEVRDRRERPALDTGATALAVPGAPGAGGAKQLGAIDPRLLPTADTYAHLAGGPRDYGIHGVDEGDVTSLNTRRFKYATFYSQMYAAVAGTWNPRVSRAYNSRDPDHRMFGGKDYETQVDVTLDAQGRIKQVRLVRSCGLDFLDREAIDAFRDAAPFPNPPHGIVDESGEIKLGTWSFVFQTTRASVYRDRPPGW